MRKLFSRKHNKPGPAAPPTFSTDNTPRTSTDNPRGAYDGAPSVRMPENSGLYWKKSYKELMYAFGPSEEAPQYLSILYTGWHRGRSRWVLYDGLDMKKSRKLATADKWGEKLAHTTVTVFGPSGAEITEQMTSHHALHRETWLTFSFPVSISAYSDREGAQTQLEEFEWRHSRGGDGRTADEWGWKLLRLRTMQNETSRIFKDEEELVSTCLRASPLYRPTSLAWKQVRALMTHHITNKLEFILEKKTGISHVAVTGQVEAGLGVGTRTSLRI